MVSFRITLPDGSQKKVSLLAGQIIGRAKGDLILDDPKLSSVHARLERREDRFVLVDCGSRNKIKPKSSLDTSSRVEELNLYPDVTFTLGSTEFEVLSVNTLIAVSGEGGEQLEKSEAESPSLKPDLEEQKLHQTAFVSSTPKPKDPEEILIEFCESIPIETHSLLPRPIRLVVISGPQKGLEHTILFTGKILGPEIFEIPLMTPVALEETLDIRLSPNQGMELAVTRPEKSEPEVIYPLQEKIELDVAKIRVRFEAL